MFNKKSSQKGFTLIELMVVISIIAVLSSVTLSVVNVTRVKTRSTVRLQNLTQIRNALYLYASDNGGSFPPGPGNSAAFTLYTGGAATCNNWDYMINVLAPYMKTVPIDPVGHVGNATGVCPIYTSDVNWYMYAPKFVASLLGGGVSGEEGTCLNRTILMANNAESSGNSTKQECQFTGSMATLYAKSYILVLQ